MTLAKDEVRRVARLAQLELDDAELDKLTGELDAILGYVRALERVDVSAVEPTAHVVLDRLPLRHDEPAPSLDRAAVLAAAPRADAGGFAVPAYVEE
jgi:aspartyl-tRNA(Asn)/glutamyl-tRNA(Gln) amidotransferase subunit C